MRQISLTALVAVALAAAATTGSAQQAPPSKDAGATAQGNNVFAMALYGQLAKQDGNLFFSPYSISTALAMTYGGARGDTAEAMATTLHFGPGQKRLHPAFKELMAWVNGGDGVGKARKYQLVTANRLFGQQGFTFLPEFLKSTEAHYGAGLQQLDFRGDTEASRKTINGWVEEQTKDKIKELLKPGVLDRQTRLVLTNAIYFKAAWMVAFDPKATKKEAFHLANGTRADVQMMNAHKKILYGENDLCQMVQLPYEYGELSMEVLLPKKGKDLADLEKTLTSANLAEWASKMKGHEVTLSLPKFKMTSAFSLKNALSALGMEIAFDDKRADFSGMTSEAPLYISAVIHKAFVDVHEAGTEAAAATAVIMADPASAPPKLQPATFRADRPFVFVLRDVRTGSVLFMGRVTDPR